MYLPKLTRKEKEERLSRLIKNRNEIVSDPKKEHPDSASMIAKWKIFIALPLREQNRIRLEWEEYYKKIQDSVAKAIFEEQQKAAERNDWARVKDLASQARQMREDGVHITIPLPTSIDPWEFERGWVKAYLDTERMIKETASDLNTEVITEARQIFED